MPGPRQVTIILVSSYFLVIGSTNRLSVLTSPSVIDRLIVLGPGLPPIPERLLLAHARGEVLFVTGAGISRPSCLPDFRGLVIEVYAKLDIKVHSVLTAIPQGVCDQWIVSTNSLNDKQVAEIRRFIKGDYDVVLGMLERRMDTLSARVSSVRTTISQVLRGYEARPAPIHRALMQLSDRAGLTTIVTTNFDWLLEEAKQGKGPIQTYTLGGIPRPSRSHEFAGVLHIHGALDRDPERASDLIITDHDFGEFYMRRRAVSDFIYDAARLFHLVLVGYSANDPPMRYLLNAVAADGSRFDDLKERFTFVGTAKPDPIEMEDWKGRGITPVPYDKANDHAILRLQMERWAELSAINGNKRAVDTEIRRIVKQSRTESTDADRDLFDHFFRRESPIEQKRLSALASRANADIGWLDAIMDVLAEPRNGQR